MPVRGFNADPDTVEILAEYDVKKMQFSKFMNNVVKEWHTDNKQKEYDKKNPKPQVRLIG